MSTMQVSCVLLQKAPKLFKLEPIFVARLWLSRSIYKRFLLPLGSSSSLDLPMLAQLNLFGVPIALPWR